MHFHVCGSELCASRLFLHAFGGDARRSLLPYTPELLPYLLLTYSLQLLCSPKQAKLSLPTSSLHTSKEGVEPGG